MRLLIAEGDVEYARVLESGFEDERYVVDRAADAREVWRLIKTHDHDGLILTGRLTGPNGVKLWRRPAAPLIATIARAANGLREAFSKLIRDA